MKQDYNTRATYSNTPHLRENIVLICSFYFFTGLNYIITGIAIADGSKTPIAMLIMLGIVFLAMVPISIRDRRKEMCGMLAVICTGILLLATAIGISYFSGFWLFMIVYLIEALISAAAAIVSIKLRKAKGKGQKQKRQTGAA